MRKKKAWAVGIGLVLIAIWIGAIAIAQATSVHSGDSIKAVASGSTDIDGDDIRYEFRWSVVVGGVTNARPEYDTVSDRIVPPYTETGQSIIPPDVILKGETWRVAVRAFDGEDYGPEAEASVLVGGQPPVGAVVHIEVVE